MGTVFFIIVCVCGGPSQSPIAQTPEEALRLTVTLMNYVTCIAINFLLKSFPVCRIAYSACDSVNIDHQQQIPKAKPPCLQQPGRVAHTNACVSPATIRRAIRTASMEPLWRSLIWSIMTTRARITMTCFVVNGAPSVAPTAPVRHHAWHRTIGCFACPCSPFRCCARYLRSAWPVTCTVIAK